MIRAFFGFVLRLFNAVVIVGLVVGIVSWIYYWKNVAYSSLDVETTTVLIFLTMFIFGLLAFDWIQEIFLRFFIPAFDRDASLVRQLTQMFILLIIDVCLAVSYAFTASVTPEGFRLRPMYPKFWYRYRDDEPL